ncbi:MAG TPA: hypothetical protein DCY17_01240 [Clostridiales bacterium]|nr:hypothetical protein [Clostridiales bacterium]
MLFSFQFEFRLLSGGANFRQISRVEARGSVRRFSAAHQATRRREPSARLSFGMPPNGGFPLYVFT